jgi:hypothetical protein
MVITGHNNVKMHLRRFNGAWLATDGYHCCMGYSPINAGIRLESIQSAMADLANRRYRESLQLLGNAGYLNQHYGEFGGYQNGQQN